MTKQIKTEYVLSEPMYDDASLMQIEKQELEELITGLVDYCISLEKQVISLRKQVNRLSPPAKVKPYFDLHSDLYEVFHQYSAYSKYKHILKKLD